jgi:hypothetical protein
MTGFRLLPGLNTGVNHLDILIKSQLGFRLWRNNPIQIFIPKALLGLKRNSDWILNSAAVDPSGIRNLVSFEIWSNMDKLGLG